MEPEYAGLTVLYSKSSVMILKSVDLYKIYSYCIRVGLFKVNKFFLLKKRSKSEMSYDL